MTRPTIELAAIIIDCAEPGPVARFYLDAAAGEMVRDDADGVWIKFNGNDVIFRRVEGYRSPTWPSSDEQMQVHFDFSVDDMAVARDRLESLGARVCAVQPHDPQHLTVMTDPAGHLFCIGPR
jgi:catechol 2,3-dioxygenase-like lactoylglutathione lyase family enzyme